jgi:hypothetical protein
MLVQIAGSADFVGHDAIMVTPSRRGVIMQTITTFDNAAGWERALYAFLAEKERRSGSRRTVAGYSRMLQHFFSAVGTPGLRHGRL